MGSSVPAAAGLLVELLTAAGGRTAGDRVLTPNDWREVEELAVRQGLAPLLFKRLKQGDARDRVQAGVWERLRRAYFASAGRNARLYREIRAVLLSLRSHGIQVIVLKGAYLAEAVYGDIALRPMSDADLLVLRAELPRAEAVVLDACRVHRPRGSREVRWARSTLPRLPSGAVVDLHTTVAFAMGPFRIDPAGLWDRARPATIAGVDVLSLSPADLLLHVCLHLSYSHGFESGLRPLCDVTETIRHHGSAIDWPQVVRSARAWGATRYAGLSLYLARQVLGAAVPDDALKSLVPGGIDREILEAAEESVLAQSRPDEWAVPPIFSLWGAESFGDKAKVCWQRVFLSRDELAAMYPASRGSKLRLLYYALRVRDVTRTYAHHALNRRRMAKQDRVPERMTVDGRPTTGTGRAGSLADWLTAQDSSSGGRQ